MLVYSSNGVLRNQAFKSNVIRLNEQGHSPAIYRCASHVTSRVAEQPGASRAAGRTLPSHLCSFPQVNYHHPAPPLRAHTLSHPSVISSDPDSAMSSGGTSYCPTCDRAVYAAEKVMGPGRKVRLACSMKLLICLTSVPCSCTTRFVLVHFAQRPRSVGSLPGPSFPDVSQVYLMCKTTRLWRIGGTQPGGASASISM